MPPGPGQAHDDRSLQARSLLASLMWGLAAAGLAWLALIALSPLLGGLDAALLLLLPVALVAAYSGLTAGVTSLAAGTVLAGSGRFGLRLPERDGHELILFALVGLTVSGIAARMRDARDDERARRRQADQEAHRLAMATAAVPVVICAFRQAVDGRLTVPYANERIRELLGVPAGELRTDAAIIFDSMPAADAARVRQRMDGSRRSRAAWRERFSVRRADGAQAWVEGYFAPVPDDDGGITWHGGLADVTREVQAARTAERWQRLFERAQIGIAAADPATDTWIAANHIYAAWRGYAPEELIGRKVDTAYPDATREVSTARVREAERTGHAVYETELLRRDGSRFPAMVDLTVIKDEHGRPLERVGFIIDLSQQKQVEASARAWQRAFDQSGLSIALVDTELRFLAVNNAFARARGYTATELAGQSVGVVYPEDTWSAVTAFVAGAGDHWQLEAEHRRKDGGRFPVLIDVTAIRDDQGVLTTRVAFVQDLTARVAAEQALRRRERQLRDLNAALESRVQERTAQLAAANAELEAFASSVSHDLRAPLRGIDGWSLALLEDYGGTLDPKAREYLERVRSETQRMRVLIADLLQLSRVSRSPLVLEEVDVTALATAVSARLTDTHPDRTLVFTIEPGLAVAADQRLLEIVLTNLLDNAVKFTRGREPGLVAVRALKYAGARGFQVEDNGAGFDMSLAEALFRPFKRLHAANEFPGTGIGLATVQRVVVRHGGRIWAEAGVGVGATFCVMLPSASGA